MHKFIQSVFLSFAFAASAFGQSLTINPSTRVDMGVWAQTKMLASKSVSWMQAEPTIPPLVAPVYSERMKAAGIEFPLRTCLFFTYRGEVQGTWGFFGRDADEAWRNGCAKWLNDRDMNCIIFLTYCYDKDPKKGVSLFKNGYATEVDPGQVAIMERWLKAGKNAGSFMIPCLFVDDDGTADQPWDKHKRYFDLIIPFLSKYCAAICLAIESNEKFGNAKTETMVAYIKTLTTLPVGTHMAWDCKSPLPRGLDFLLFEHSWHPAQGDSKSVNQVVSEVVKAINASGLPVGPCEWNLNPAGSIIVEQAKGLKSRTPIVLNGGPIKFVR
jgi:hypothetical protein